jgi:hypothetical protein
MQVSLVPTQLVYTYWESVGLLLCKAEPFTYGRYTVDDMHTSVMNGTHQLWVVSEGYEVKGVVLTTIAYYPQKKCLSLDFIAGDDGWEWKDLMLDALRKWAVYNNCDTLESVGRPGWEGIFKDDGFKKLGVAYELPVKQGEE